MDETYLNEAVELFFDEKKENSSKEVNENVDFEKELQDKRMLPIVPTFICGLLRTNLKCFGSVRKRMIPK
ncbi:hypothetical protein PN36_29030 [Candidatus Thiomargarita nelsonii]|uniref:Uncharacterized protein n=1 Tax=Candidatus Thiomargarita nelsonii TaxID=1003181 RepID=A0A4E0QJW2_9GAMM|nr:hypothetical protein PN36_29030 [Candidatus Thiomargarita nelsonii]